ncbi:MAG: hypothetical protein AAGL96_19305 [Pseudomonadota bacterium]
MLNLLVTQVFGGNLPARRNIRKNKVSNLERINLWMYPFSVWRVITHFETLLTLTSKYRPNVGFLGCTILAKRGAFGGFELVIFWALALPPVRSSFFGRERRIQD